MRRAREQVESAAQAAHNTVDPNRDAAPEKPRLAPVGVVGTKAVSANANGRTIPTVFIDADKYPETAQHVEEAQSGKTWRGDKVTDGARHPSVVTIDRPNAEENREDSLRGIPTKKGHDRDEYPARHVRGGR